MFGCTQHGQHGAEDGRQEGHHAKHCKKGRVTEAHGHPDPATQLELSLHSLGGMVEQLGPKEPRCQPQNL